MDQTGLSTLKRFSRPWGIVPSGALSRACSYGVWQWRRIVVYVLLHDYVNVRVCNLHNPHHTGHIENRKQHTADLQLVALFPSHLVLVQFFGSQTQAG